MAACVLFLSKGRPLWAAPEGSPWGKEYFSNVLLTDQDGNKLRFYDDLIKDKVVAVNFIFTHCGDSCPAETASLRKVRQLLGGRFGKDIFFYSISIDPDRDTPKMLKEYAERFRLDSGWRFLTGRKSDITLLRKKLGLFRDGIEDRKLGEHSTSFMIGNERTGQWLKRSPFDEPKVLAWLLSYSLAGIKPVAAAGASDYKEAGQLAKLSKGEDIFRFRCSTCHSLGKEDGLGPGLLGVTRTRGRKWLTRWIQNPDRLLKAKDPVATKLYNRYNKIPMPNLKLDKAEVEAVINFMDSVKQ